MVAFGDAGWVTGSASAVGVVIVLSFLRVRGAARPQRQDDGAGRRGPGGYPVDVPGGPRAPRPPPAAGPGGRGRRRPGRRRPSWAGPPPRRPGDRARPERGQAVPGRARYGGAARSRRAPARGAGGNPPAPPASPGPSP